MKSCKVLGGKQADAIAAASSVEMIHNFTLVHDDIMDNDEMRHGVPTTHNKFDMPLAILAGDVLYSKAYHTISSKSKLSPNHTTQLVTKKIVKGFTTNPSLMRKAGAKDYTTYSKNILKVTKKPVGNDIREGKKSLPILLAIRKARGNDKKKILKVFGKSKAAKKDVQTAVNTIRSLGIEEEVRKKALQYATKATKSLDSYSGSDKNEMVSLLDFVVKRSL